ncbi:MAG: mechanosensitive ion channel family protein [Gemmatimonadetes bacterium]|nr:mechanosensitive ion channel family protein [Gemmatimonadota bacterium]
MIQGTPSSPIPDSLAVPLPPLLERYRELYAHDLGQKILLFLGFALFLYSLARLARRLVSDQIEEVNRRHAIRKGIGYALIAILLLFAVALFADSLAGFGTVVGLMLAGIAVALQDVLKSVVGWLYLSTRSGVEVGSRIEVAGVAGDIIDVGMLKTTMLEVGNLVFGMQSTGRLVTVPNYQMLSANVIISGHANPFVWQEVRIVVPFDSDWQRAEAILRGVGEELHAGIEPELHAGFRRLEKRYAFKYGTLTPIVYVTLGGSGAELTLRFLTYARGRRGSEDQVGRRLLTAFAAEPNVHFAYETMRVIRHGERDTGIRQ